MAFPTPTNLNPGKQYYWLPLKSSELEVYLIGTVEGTANKQDGRYLRLHAMNSGGGGRKHDTQVHEDEAVLVDVPSLLCDKDDLMNLGDFTDGAVLHP